jgi:hypothetical protein
MTTLLIIFLIFVFLMSLGGVIGKVTGHWVVKFIVRGVSFFCLLMAFYLILLIATGVNLLSTWYG